MYSTWTTQREELCCPICRDIFQEPALLPCGHSFCRVCVCKWWSTRRQQQGRTCPVCKSETSTDAPARNLALKNLCEAFQLEVDSGSVCSLHHERLKLYCLDHRTPVCVVCRDSTQHANHRFVPVDEAAKSFRNALREAVRPLQEKVILLNHVKLKWERLDEDIKNQAQVTEGKIVEEFNVLQEFLLTEKEVRIAALKEEETLKRNRMKEKMTALIGDVNPLESTINSVEGGLSDNDASFISKARGLWAITTAAQRSLPDDPEQVTGACIDVAKHLGNMRFNVWCKMKEIVSYSPVILNPNTAHPLLHLSEDLTNVRFGPEQIVPVTPERMEQHRSVLGHEGFTSGSHSWDVDIGGNPVWALGVMAPAAQSTGDMLSGLWMVRFYNGKFTAFSPLCPVSDLPLKGRLQRVRVHLDWEKGTLSFMDGDTNATIHAFTHTFTERLFPYINTWSDLPLKIMPVNLSITATQQLGCHKIQKIW